MFISDISVEISKISHLLAFSLLIHTLERLKSELL
jgi:hypothetical protein